jgi:hypothetical protein
MKREPRSRVPNGLRSQRLKYLRFHAGAGELNQRGAVIEASILNTRSTFATEK